MRARRADHADVEVRVGRRAVLRAADRLLHPPAVRGWLHRKLQSLPDVAELV